MPTVSEYKAEQAALAELLRKKDALQTKITAVRAGLHRMDRKGITADPVSPVQTPAPQNSNSGFEIPAFLKRGYVPLTEVLVSDEEAGEPS